MMKQLLKSVVAVGAVAMAAQTASAGLVLSIQPENATGGATISGQNVTPAAGGKVDLGVYATISGADASVVNDGLSFVYFAVTSTQNSGGALLSTKGITGNTLDPNFAKVGASAVGVIADVNGDGIPDLGTLADTSANQPKAGGLTTPVLCGTAGVGVADGSAWKFKLATIAVDLGTTFGSGSTVYSLRFPNMTGALKGAQWQEDGVVKYNTTSALTINPSAVTFAAVPEPASLGLLAVGALGLLARRRQA